MSIDGLINDFLVTAAFGVFDREDMPKMAKEMKQSLHSLLLGVVPEEHICEVEHPLKVCFYEGWTTCRYQMIESINRLFEEKV